MCNLYTLQCNLLTDYLHWVLKNCWISQLIEKWLLCVGNQITFWVSLTPLFDLYISGQSYFFWMTVKNLSNIWSFSSFKFIFSCVIDACDHTRKMGCSNTKECWDELSQIVKLLILDEVHYLLHEDRGPVLESIVARTLR